MLEVLLNSLLFRRFRAEIVGRRFVACIQSEFAETFLDVLLNLMSLLICVDKDFRRNLKDFDARYLFKSKDGTITVAAVFYKERLKVSKKQIDNTNVTVIFKDQKALMNFLLSSQPDIFNAILNQELNYEGNLNYLSKFAFMARHLQLMFTKLATNV